MPQENSFYLLLGRLFRTVLKTANNGSYYHAGGGTKPGVLRALQSALLAKAVPPQLVVELTSDRPGTSPYKAELFTDGKTYLLGGAVPENGKRWLVTPYLPSAYKLPMTLRLTATGGAYPVGEAVVDIPITSPMNVAVFQPAGSDAYHIDLY